MAGIISPYQVAPPQGGVMGFLADWTKSQQDQELQRIALEQQMQDRQRRDQTMTYLNNRAGYESGVDPGAVLEFLTGQSNLDTAQLNRQVTQQNMDNSNADRAAMQRSAEGVWSALGQGGALEGSYSAPSVRALLEGGANPQLLGALIEMINGIDTRGQQFINESTLQNSAHRQASERIAQQGGLEMEAIDRRADADNRVTSFRNDLEQSGMADERARQALANQAVAQFLGLGARNPQEAMQLGMIPSTQLGSVLDARMLQQQQQMTNLQQLTDAILKDENVSPAVRQQLYADKMNAMAGGEVPEQTRERMIAQARQLAEEAQRMIEAQQQERRDMPLGEALRRMLLGDKVYEGLQTVPGQ